MFSVLMKTKILLLCHIKLLYDRGKMTRVDKFLLCEKYGREFVHFFCKCTWNMYSESRSFRLGEAPVFSYNIYVRNAEATAGSCQCKKGGYKVKEKKKGRAQKKSKQSFLSKLKMNKELLILSAPGAIWFLLFAYLPLFGILVAFKQYRLSGNFFESLINSKFVGLDNFKFLFSSGDAWIILRNTVLYNAAFIILGVVLPVIVALLLNELRNKGMTKVYQSSMFLPYFLSWVVVSYCVYAFLNPEKGYFNSIIQQFGGEGISWYTEKGLWPFIIIIMSQGKGIGYNTVVYLASICGINKTYYEAAVIDGATKWQQMKYITLPLLKPVITILLIMAVGGIFKSDFGLFYQLPRDSGPLYPVTNVLDTYIFRALQTNGEIGMSSAAALFQSVVGFIMIMGANKLVSKIDEENALF